MSTPKNTPRPANPITGDPGDRDPRNSAGNILSRSWFWIVLAILVLFGSRFLLSRPSDSGDIIGLNKVAPKKSTKAKSRRLRCRVMPSPLICKTQAKCSTAAKRVTELARHLEKSGRQQRTLNQAAHRIRKSPQQRSDF